MKRPILPPHRDGIAADIIAIIANLFLFPFASTRLTNLFEASFQEEGSEFLTLAGLITFALVARLVGLYLKRFSLQARHGSSDDTWFPKAFFIFDFVLFALTSAFAYMFLLAIGASMGLVETDWRGQPKESFTIIILSTPFLLFSIAVQIALIWRLSKPLTAAERKGLAARNWMYDARGEFVADFGLFAYMMVWQVFYNMVAKMMMTPPGQGPEPWGYRFFAMGFLVIPFVMFYIGPRAVFLIEDRKYLGTWLFMLGVFLASILPYW